MLQQFIRDANRRSELAKYEIPPMPSSPLSPPPALQQHLTPAPQQPPAPAPQPQVQHPIYQPYLAPPGA